MPVYKVRCECETDYLNFTELLSRDARVKNEVITKIEDELPDIEVEFYSIASFGELKNIMRMVEDGHVMVQTVMPADKYTGIRNYDA